MKPGGLLLILFSLGAGLVLTMLPLPDSVAVARPAFAALIVAYWCLHQPGRFGLFGAWALGLCLDVSSATLLGQHALALTLVAYIALKLRDTLRMFPAWQQAVVLLPVWAVYELILFWIDGFAGQSADPMWRWMPVLSTTLAWPLISLLLFVFAAPRRQHA